MPFVKHCQPWPTGRVADATSSSHPIALLDAPVSYVPYIRKRVTPTQLKALQEFFSVNSHPGKEDRLALANEIGMEVKSVTNWFQNRRQTAKKRAHIWKGSPRKHHHHSFLKRINKGASSSRSMRSSVSLDRIAELSERPSVPTTSSSTLRSPLTPRNRNISRCSNISSSKFEIWQHMLSSPVVPQISPSVEEARLSILPPRSKTWRSLEWACLRDRRDRMKMEEEEDKVPELLFPGPLAETDSETEDDEAITPDSSVNLSPRVESPSKLSRHRISSKRDKENGPVIVKLEHTPSEDFEAALALLDFTRRK